MKKIGVPYCALSLNQSNDSYVFLRLDIIDNPSDDVTYKSHLNRDQIEFNLSVPGIKGRHENALYKSFEMNPHLLPVR